MAMWQFDCMFISNNKIHMDRKLDEFLSWKGIELPINIKELIGEMIEENMVDKEKVQLIINKRKNMHPDNPRIEHAWEWLIEVFDDLSEKFKSVAFIRCLERLQNKFKDVDMEVDIEYARNACRQNAKYFSSY